MIFSSFPLFTSSSYMYNSLVLNFNSYWDKHDSAEKELFSEIEKAPGTDVI